MNKQPIQKHLVHVFLLSLIILLIGGGVALLNQWQQAPVSSHASDDNVVGSPSLPASYVDAIFRRAGSPMVGTGQAVEDAARAQNIDDAFALAVWWTETNDGAAGVGLHYRNPGSVRGSIGYPSGGGGYTIYPSYSVAATYWFGMLKKVYINRGRTTVSAISHPYVGTSTSNLWAGKVITLMNHYRAAAPKQPAPSNSNANAASTASTANASSVANANIARHAKAFAQQDQGLTYPQDTAQNLAASTQQADSSGLSGNIKLLLVLFDLLAALGLGLLARSMMKRSASSTQLTGVLNGGSSLQEKIRAGFQQSGVFKPAFTSTGPLRTTEGLTWPAPMAATFAATNAATPTYASDGLLSLGAFMASQTQELAYAPSTQHTYTGQWPQFNTPTPDASQATRLPGLVLPSRPTQQPGAAAPNPLHRTRLLPSRPSTDQFPPFVPDPATDKQPQLVATGTGNGHANGLLSRYRDVQSGQ